MASIIVSGQLVDVHQRRTYPAELHIANGRISSVIEVASAAPQYILPGFIDAHVHIESSMLVPTAFARMAVVHGTVATVSDPHEIANVCGIAGVQYMIDNARNTPFKFFFGAPSCVPATAFETAGARLDATAIATLLASPDIWYLAEMMNFPGVLQGDEDVLAKISAANAAGKPVDGHAPGLRGLDAQLYAAAGINTDHECTSLVEALEKISYGMHILIREGSAAKNFDALHPLLGSNPARVMLCSDDKHPDELAIGHINLLVRRAVALGYDLYDVLLAACINPVVHYKLPVGMLRAGDPADFIITEDLKDFKVLRTYIDGILVAEGGQTNLPTLPALPINNFSAAPRAAVDFRMPVSAKATEHLSVIHALDGQLFTKAVVARPKTLGHFLVSDIGQDLLKLAVINRYERFAKPAMAFIHGFGLREGAIASSVAHDCHNIIAAGVDDASLCAAVNAVIAHRGGIAVVDGRGHVEVMPLPIAGLMTDVDGREAGVQYAALDAAAKRLGSPLSAPFMTLSFMALLVIPELKLSDLGLFDGNNFRFVSNT